MIDFNELKEAELIAGKDPEEIDYSRQKVGVMSGFFDLDHRIGGFRPWYIVFTGATGHGKTTVTRQFVLAAARNGKKPFYFVGEEALETELRNMAKIGAPKEEIESIMGLAGRHYYAPTKERFQWFVDTVRDKLILESYFELSRFAEKIKIPVSEIVFKEMERAFVNGSRFFVLDNLAKMVESHHGKSIFDAQRKVVKRIQQFVRKHRVPVILVTHPNKAGNDVSGISEIENFADCVIKIRRLMESDPITHLLKGVPAEFIPHTSALLVIKKAREDGLLGKIPLKWDEMRGMLVNLTHGLGANQYEDDGWWVKTITPF